MMFPLWTNVTLLRWKAMAYSMAERIRRSEPSFETGLMPMPLVSGKRILPNSLGKASLNRAMNFFARFAARFRLMPA